MRIIENKEYLKYQKRINSDGRGMKRGNNIVVKRGNGVFGGVIEEMYAVKNGRYSFIEYLIKLPSGKLAYVDRNDYNNIVKVGE